jgi:hypothetical protein
MWDLLAQQGGLLQPGGGFGLRDYAFFLATLVTVSAASSVAFIFAFVTRLGQSDRFQTSGRTKFVAACFLLGTAVTTVIQSYAVVKQEPTINTGQNSGQVGWVIFGAHLGQAATAAVLLAFLILDVVESMRNGQAHLDEERDA